MADGEHREEWSPIPLRYVIQGHVTTETLLIPVYLLACWLCGRIMPTIALSFGVLSASVIIAALASAIPNACILHAISVHERTDHPSPWYLVPQALCLALIAAVVVMVLTGGRIQALALGLIMAVVSLVVELLMLPRSKDQVMSRAKVRENMERTRDMTHEVFADEIAHLHDEQRRKLDEENRAHGIDRIHRS
ncbi:hypothetical protein BMIN_0008 [Bifidobacterium minimum]|uniref:Uncharacterized protein n=1 Tax=Bifidobacterium minimum TaxID=1693 RepID=A0A087BM70_9BIFI|nr:hypothetical protein [Bifidobacterium minimum]KFI72120.1 hypothetical protein BMIN_0008 [Bifidobacterium minimum]